MPGPVPKRSSQRRRRNAPEGVQVAKGQASEDVEAPPAEAGWHPIAQRWYDALAASGQSDWYEPSDWATAVLIAESMSRDLEDQVVGITEDGKVVKDRIPLKGASLNAYLKAFGALMVTEGDRRRARIELEHGGPVEVPPEVAIMADYRAAAAD